MKCVLIDFSLMLKSNAEIAVKVYTGFREIMGTWLLPYLLPQKLLRWEACSISIVSQWGAGGGVRWYVQT